MAIDQVDPPIAAHPTEVAAQSGLTADARRPSTTMKAIVQDSYGLPASVLKLREVAKPLVSDGDVLVRVHAASIHAGDFILARGVPYFLRFVTGIRKPKQRIPGTDIAGTVEAVGKDVTLLQVGDEVFGWCTGAFAEYASAHRGPLRPEAGQPHLRTGRGRRRVRHDCAPAPARPGQGQAGPEGPDQRRLGRRRDVRRADRQGVRRRGDRRVQHGERGHGPLDRRRPRHRLHQGRLHQGSQRYDFILDNVGNHSLADTRRALTPDGTLQPNGGGHSAGRWIGSMGGVIKTALSSMFGRGQLAPSIKIQNRQGPGRPEGTRRSRARSRRSSTARIPLSRTPEAHGSCRRRTCPRDGRHHDVTRRAAGRDSDDAARYVNHHHRGRTVRRWAQA